jgi:hypothetical protein
VLRRDGSPSCALRLARVRGEELRREIGWMASVAVPLVLVIAALRARGEEAWRESVGRGALIAIARRG